MDPRLNLTDLTRDLIAEQVNVILYRHGRVEIGAGRIDVYWKGQENGNLMALFAYIISQSGAGAKNQDVRAIRIIRKLMPEEEAEFARDEMKELIRGARLDGEVLILERDDKRFQETVAANSDDAAMILMGMPGENMGAVAQVFQLDELFFTKQIEAYEDFPPILFVKASSVFDLYA